MSGFPSTSPFLYRLGSGDRWRVQLFEGWPSSQPIGEAAFALITRVRITFDAQSFDSDTTAQAFDWTTFAADSALEIRPELFSGLAEFVGHARLEIWLGVDTAPIQWAHSEAAQYGLRPMAVAILS